MSTVYKFVFVLFTWDIKNKSKYTGTENSTFFNDQTLIKTKQMHKQILVNIF